MSNDKRTTDESLDKVTGGVSNTANIDDLNNPNKNDDFKNPMLTNPFSVDEKEGGHRKIDSLRNSMLVNPSSANNKNSANGADEKPTVKPFIKPF